jgi:hypothetical protein
LIPASNTKLCIVKTIISKKVANITKGVTDANNSTASPGDILEYTLYTTNTATKLSTEQTTSEPISDLLDYSDINNLGNAKQLDTTLVWPKVTIVAGDTLKQSFRVKVKSVIPTTPISTTDSGTFDLKMINTYGNSTTVNLPCPAVLCAQNTAKNLPKTGPGSSLLITFMILCLVAFFYNRNRVLVKELNLIKLEHSTGA